MLHGVDDCFVSRLVLMPRVDRLTHNHADSRFYEQGYLQNLENSRLPGVGLTP